jgi:hypothetical protein
MITNHNYYLFLDDIRQISDARKYCVLPNINDEEWIIVRNYQEFVDLITLRGLPKFVCYDHDLGSDQYGHGLNNDEIPYDSFKDKTGYDAAKWLINYCMERSIKHPPYVVHSMNPVGKRNIESYIESYNKSL